MNLAALNFGFFALLTASTLGCAAGKIAIDLEHSLPPDERDRMYRDMDRFASTYPGREQMEERRQKMLRDRFKLADPDNDGSISREEAEAHMPSLARHFDEVDSDGDGVISSEEMFGAQNKFREQRESRELQALQARQESERLAIQPPPRSKPSKKRPKTSPDADTSDGS